MKYSIYHIDVLLIVSFFNIPFNKQTNYDVSSYNFRVI